MTKHIILWKLKDELSDKESVKREAKNALEALVGKIDGLNSVRVNIDTLPSSNVDMMLDSEFESPAALYAYAEHPAHVAVADRYVRPFIATRACIDFEI